MESQKRFRLPVGVKKLLERTEVKEWCLLLGLMCLAIGIGAQFSFAYACIVIGVVLTYIAIRGVE